MDDDFQLIELCMGHNDSNRPLIYFGESSC